MQIDFSGQKDADAIAIIIGDNGNLGPIGENLNTKSNGALKRALDTSPHAGKPGRVTNLIAPEGLDYQNVLLLGAGEESKRGVRVWERAGARTVKALLNSGVKHLAITAYDADIAARMALGGRLAAYRFDNYRTKLKPENKPTLNHLSFIVDDINAAKAAYLPLEAACSGTELARDLMSEPPNILYPESFAERIQSLSEYGLEIEILGEAQMQKLGMHALLGVGQGSVRESKLAIMRWMGGEGEEVPLALVGKGVCFDTGGISLKPGASMEEMKGDMGGAAAVCGAMLSLAKRKAKANVVGLVGLVENMPDGAAQRPGDIVTSMSGQTIEIQNTDAEGRLVLCDVLWYTQETYQPDTIIDLATLTGAILISLGNEYAGLFCNNDALADNLIRAGEAEGEPLWRMPLNPAYDKMIDSKFADMRNIGGRNAGSSTAAQFLQRYIQNDTAWAHLDIAGTAWREGKDNPLEPAWASGYGARLLDRYVKDRFER